MICPRCGRRELPGWLGGLTKAYTDVFGTVMPLMWVFVLLCLLVFFGMYLPVWARAKGNFSALFGSQELSSVLRWGGLVNFGGRGGMGRITAQEPWRWLSAMFVHFGPLHLGMNLMTLVALGRELEPRLGSGRFGVVFLGTGIVGFMASDAWCAISASPSLTGGASGGLYGLIGALIGYLFARKDPKYRAILLEVAVLGVAMALLFPVNNAAHVGGFVAGVPLGMLFFREKRPWRLDLFFGSVAGLLTVLSLVSIGLSMRSPLVAEAKRAESQHIFDDD
jgi:membrane associated rhomboid family serine protease